jgi:hypothetical protein
MRPICFAVNRRWFINTRATLRWIPGFPRETIPRKQRPAPAASCMLMLLGERTGPTSGVCCDAAHHGNITASHQYDPATHASPRRAGIAHTDNAMKARASRCTGHIGSVMSTFRTSARDVGR